MHAKRPCEAVVSGSTVQSLQMASLAAETTGGEVLVAFWPKHGLRSDLKVPNLQNFLGGAYPDSDLPYSLSIPTIAVPV